MTHFTCTLTARTRISSGTLRSVIEYGLPLLFYYCSLLGLWVAVERCLFLFKCSQAKLCSLRSIHLSRVQSRVVHKLGWPMGWVGLGHKKWTHGQLWSRVETLISSRLRWRLCWHGASRGPSAATGLLVSEGGMQLVFSRCFSPACGRPSSPKTVDIVDQA